MTDCLKRSDGDSGQDLHARNRDLKLPQFPLDLLLRLRVLVQQEGLAAVGVH
jgi:hypothetical protein